MKTFLQQLNIIQWEREKVFDKLNTIKLRQHGLIGALSGYCAWIGIVITQPEINATSLLSNMMTSSLKALIISFCVIAGILIAETLHNKNWKRFITHLPMIGIRVGVASLGSIGIMISAEILLYITGLGLIRPLAWSAFGAMIGGSEYWYGKTTFHLALSTGAGIFGGFIGGTFFDSLSQSINGAAAQSFAIIVLATSLTLAIALMAEASKEAALFIGEREFALIQHRTIIGKTEAPDCIPLYHASIDQAHATITKTSKGYILACLATPLALNDTPLTQGKDYPLSHNDIIGFADGEIITTFIEYGENES